MLHCTDALPDALYTASAVRELDRRAIEEQGIAGIRLMKRAGRVAFAKLCARWPEAEHIHVFCGTGNNGGDGYVVAALAAESRLPVTVYQVGDAQKLAGDALRARDYAVAAGVTMAPWTPGTELSAGVVVDALLGTGLSGEVRPAFAEAIAAINASSLPVLAIDIPSGLCSDSGRRLGTAVAADCTVSFIGLKRGLLTGEAVDCVGELGFSELGVDGNVYAQVEPSVALIGPGDAAAALPRRPRSSHKGHCGHVLVVGGDHGMAGAAILAAMSAARVGAGLVSCASRPEHVAALLANVPEVMACGVNSGQDLEPLLARASVVVIGPGLGRGPWGQQLLQRVLASELPLVVDADALNLIAAGSAGSTSAVPRHNWILTPHPGEAARLLDSDSRTVQADRFAAVEALRQRWGGVALLKGAGSLVAGENGLALSPCGNPGMASGGMGDVLSGVLGGLLAQGLELESAARVGCWLHGRAADLASLDGERGLLASDLLPQLRRLVNAL